MKVFDIFHQMYDKISKLEDTIVNQNKYICKLEENIIGMRYMMAEHGICEYDDDDDE